MRNSVKAVIDAYDGTTTFYVFDTDDPILAAYRGIFPSLFKDASAMPAWLRKHVRYPELLLSLQAEVYGLYHMTNPEVFYNREDLWTVATETGMAAGRRADHAAHAAELRADEAARRRPAWSLSRFCPSPPPTATTSSAGSPDAAMASTTAHRWSTTFPRPGWSTGRSRSKRASTRTRSSPAS